MNHPKVCVWQEDQDGVWITACGDSFFIADTTPSDNGMKYCCYCGEWIDERRNINKPYTEEEH